MNQDGEDDDDDDDDELVEDPFQDGYMDDLEDF